MSSSSKQEKDGSVPAASPVVKTRHSKFYFDNTLVVIEIENVLFNVHKYQLMKSETFSDMFKTATGDPEEGSSPEKPIVMEGVAASDFECLLTVLYATRFSTYQPAPEASLIIPAFRLANKWNFEDLRNYLLPLAEKELSDIDKIVFAREFGISAWLAPAHIKLCQRTEPLTTDEAVKLGIHSLLLISRMREEFPRPIATPGAHLCGPCAGYTIYYSSNQECSKCNGYGRTVVLDAVSHDASIGTKVEKWVNDGCVFSA